MLAGGRGKGRFAKYPKGGVQLLYNADEIEDAAKGMIGKDTLIYIQLRCRIIFNIKTGIRAYVFLYKFIDNCHFTIAGDFLITKQTTAEGRICNSVMITERKYTRKEYYLAFMNERAFSVSILEKI